MCVEKYEVMTSEKDRASFSVPTKFVVDSSDRSIVPQLFMPTSNNDAETSLADTLSFVLCSYSD